MKIGVLLLFVLSLAGFSQEHKLGTLITDSYQLHKDFVATPAKVTEEKLRSTLKTIEDNANLKLCSHRRAEYYHVLSLIQWDLAVKTNSKMKYGKSSYENMKKALDEDSSNLKIVQSYAQSIVGMSKNNKFKRYTIEATLGISIKNELKSVKTHLLSSSPNDNPKSNILIKQINQQL